MKLFLFGILFVNIYAEACHTSQDISKHVRHLKDEILSRKWDNNDAGCISKMFDIFNGVQNGTTWATWIWDANPKPIGHLYRSQYQLGNYDECMKAPWTHTHPQLRSQYCLVDIKLNHKNPVARTEPLDPYTTVGNYHKVSSKQGKLFKFISWGICLPSECSTTFITKYIEILLKNNTNMTKMQQNPEIQVESCQIAGEEYRYPFEFKLFWFLTAALVILVVLGTHIASDESFGTLNSLTAKIAKALCMKRNTNDLLKNSGGGMEILYGIRFLSAIIIVFGHTIIFNNSVPIANPINFEKDLESMFRNSFLHIDLTVDTYFFMSGLLLIRSFVENSKPFKRPLLLIFKRYIRLIACFAAAVFYMVAISYHTGDGPIWNKFAKYEQNMCRENWWISLLMMNNYCNSIDICYIVTWYLPCDFHMYVLAIVIFKIYLRSKRAGFITYGALVVFAVVVPGWITYVNRIPPLLLFEAATLSNLQRDPVFNNTYIRTHNRMGPFLVGMAMGYIVGNFRPKPKKNGGNSKVLRFLGAMVALIIMQATISSGQRYYFWEYNPLEAALYAGFNRIVWALAISLLVGLSAYGGIPMITSLLSWSPFIPLSRLSYGIYITHTAFLQRAIYSIRTPQTHSMYKWAVMSVGVSVLCCIASYLIYIFLEAPLVNITNLLLFSERKVKHQEESKRTEDTRLRDKHD